MLPSSSRATAVAIACGSGDGDVTAGAWPRKRGQL